MTHTPSIFLRNEPRQKILATLAAVLLAAVAFNPYEDLSGHLLVGDRVGTELRCFDAHHQHLPEKWTSSKDLGDPCGCPARRSRIQPITHRDGASAFSAHPRTLKDALKPIPGGDTSRGPTDAKRDGQPQGQCHSKKENGRLVRIVAGLPSPRRSGPRRCRPRDFDGATFHEELTRSASKRSWLGSYAIGGVPGGASRQDPLQPTLLLSANQRTLKKVFKPIPRENTSRCPSRGTAYDRKLQHTHAVAF